MNSRKAYWFEQPYLQGVKNIAVCPIVDPRDGRMYFSVPGSGIWGLYGTLIKDTEDYVEFRCDDSRMGSRGGTYKLHALDIKTFRKDTAKWVASGSEIGQACKNTDDLHFWYRKNWPNMKVFEIGEWEMQENKRKGKRTDI